MNIPYWQLIDKLTRITDSSSTLIELILVNKPENVLFSNVCDAPGVSDHCFTYAAYSLKKIQTLHYYKTGLQKCQLGCF